MLFPCSSLVATNLPIVLYYFQVLLSSALPEAMPLIFPDILLKRGNMRAATMGVTGPSPILTKIAPEVGIDPKPGHEFLF